MGEGMGRGLSVHFDHFVRRTLLGSQARNIDARKREAQQTRVAECFSHGSFSQDKAPLGVREILPSLPRPRLLASQLENKPAFQLDGASGQSVLRDSEVRIGDRLVKRRISDRTVSVGNRRGRALEGKRSKIQFVECIVNIHAQLNLGSFTDELHCWQSEVLDEAEIELTETRAALVVAIEGGEAGCVHVVVKERAIREISPRSRREKGVSVRIVLGLMEHGNRAERTDRCGPKSNVAIVGGHRRPGESGMELEVSVYFPAAQNFSLPVVAISEDGKIPETDNAQVVGGVVVRGTPFGSENGRIGLIGSIAGAFRGNFVDRLAVSVEEVYQYAIAEVVFYLGIQRVEVGIRVGCKLENGSD